MVKKKQEKWAESKQRGRSKGQGQRKVTMSTRHLHLTRFRAQNMMVSVFKCCRPSTLIPSLHAIVLLVARSIILPCSGPNTLSAADWQRHNGPLLPTWWSAQTSDGDGNRGVVASPPKAWGDKCLHLDLKTLILCFDIVLHRIFYLRLLLVEVVLLNPWPAFACSWNTSPTFRLEDLAEQTHPSLDFLSNIS